MSVLMSVVGPDHVTSILKLCHGGLITRRQTGVEGAVHKTPNNSARPAPKAMSR